VRELLALVREADIVVEPVGWIVPAGLALHAIRLGAGRPWWPQRAEQDTDPRLDLSRIGFAMPEDAKCTKASARLRQDDLDPVGQFRHWWSSSRLAA
jgi:hypothetical protein